MINKKTIMRMIILSMLLYALAGCGKKEDEFDDYALFLDEEKPVEGDAAAKDETDSQAYEKNERVIENNKSAKFAEPVLKADDLFADADLDQYTPFQNEQNSYCLINDGYATPVYDREDGLFFPFSAVNSFQSNYKLKKDKIAEVEPLDISYSVYHKKEEGIEPADGVCVSSPPEEYGGYPEMVIAAFSSGSMNGYYLTDYTLYSDGTDLSDVTRTKLEKDQIKTLIKERGALSTEIPSAIDKAVNISGYMTLNVAELQSRNLTDEAVIVGWDDDFPAQFFNPQASDKGAWLLQFSNSSEWGNKGYFWLSYDTPMPYISSFEVSDAYSDVITYNNFPVYELKTGDLTSVASVYKHPGSLGAIGFYTDDMNVSVNIEILEGKFGEMIASKQKNLENIGYHIIELDTPVDVTDFTVVVRSTGTIMVEGESSPFYLPKTSAVSGVSSGGMVEYVVTSVKDRSFAEVDGKWVDMTDESIKQYVDAKRIANDPQITVMYK